MEAEISGTIDVASAEIYDPAIRHRVFIVNSPTLWLLLNGPYRHAMARNVEIGNAIFVPSLDIEKRAIVHFDGRQGRAVNVRNVTAEPAGYMDSDYVRRIRETHFRPKLLGAAPVPATNVRFTHYFRVYAAREG